VLLMDEPFSALDPVIRRELQDELARLQEHLHKTIMFITHDLAEAVRVGDRIAIMRDGAIVQQGAPDDVVLNPADSFVREFTQDVRLHAMVTAGTIMEPPHPVADGSDLCRTVAGRMERGGLSVMRIVDDQFRYLGTAHLGALLTRPTQRCDDLVLFIGDAVWEDTVLDDLVPPGLRSPHPLAVLDQRGVLIGQIPMERLAQAMAAVEAEVTVADAGGHGEGA